MHLFLVKISTPVWVCVVAFFKIYCGSVTNAEIIPANFLETNMEWSSSCWCRSCLADKNISKLQFLSQLYLFVFEFFLPNKYVALNEAKSCHFKIGPKMLKGPEQLQAVIQFLLSLLLTSTSVIPSLRPSTRPSNSTAASIWL